MTSCSSWHPWQCIVGNVKLAILTESHLLPLPDSGGIKGQVGGRLSVAHGNGETSAQTLGRPSITLRNFSP